MLAFNYAVKVNFQVKEKRNAFLIVQFILLNRLMIHLPIKILLLNLQTMNTNTYCLQAFELKKKLI